MDQVQWSWPSEQRQWSWLSERGQWLWLSGQGLWSCPSEHWSRPVNKCSSQSVYEWWGSVFTAQLGSAVVVAQWTSALAMAQWTSTAVDAQWTLLQNGTLVFCRQPPSPSPLPPPHPSPPTHQTVKRFCKQGQQPSRGDNIQCLSFSVSCIFPVTSPWLRPALVDLCYHTALNCLCLLFCKLSWNCTVCVCVCMYGHMRACVCMCLRACVCRLIDYLIALSRGEMGIYI